MTVLVVSFQVIFWREKGWRREDPNGRAARSPLFRGEAAGFVGIDAVIAHRLLAFGREVKQRGRNEVGSLEDFEVALGRVVAL